MIKEKKRKENAEIKEYKLKYITTIIRGVLVLLVICFTEGGTKLHKAFLVLLQQQ